MVDRVDTVSTVFMGLTIGCARCHNHKYDPFTQKEYYQLYAYFNSIREDGRFSNFGNSAPWIPAPTEEQQKQLQRIDTETALARKQMDTALNAARLHQQRWEKSLLSSHSTMVPRRMSWRCIRHSIRVQLWWSTMCDRRLAVEEQSDDEAKPAESAGLGFNGGVPRYSASPLGEAVVFDGKVSFDAGKAANFDYRDRVHDFKDRFAISAWFYPESENSGAIVTRMSDGGAEQENHLPKGRGYGIFFENGKVHFNLVGVWADDSFRVERKTNCRSSNGITCWLSSTACNLMTRSKST